MQSSESSLLLCALGMSDLTDLILRLWQGLRVHLLETTSRPVTALAKEFLVEGYWFACSIPPWISCLVAVTVDCRAGSSLSAWMVDSVACTCLHGLVADVGYEVFFRLRVEGL